MSRARGRTGVSFDSLNICVEIILDPYLTWSIVISLHDVPGVGVVSSSGECNYPDFSLFIPAVFFRCPRKLCRRQSIHSCFLCDYIIHYLSPGLHVSTSIGHRQVPRLFVYLTCNVNIVFWLVFYSVTNSELYNHIKNSYVLTASYRAS